MLSDDNIKFIQMYELENDGYYEYYKTEYSKICKSDIIISTYQKVTNSITDCIREGRSLDGPQLESTEQNRVNIIASTDIIEYFK